MTKLFNDKGFWKTTIKLATPIVLQNVLISSFTLAVPSSRFIFSFVGKVISYLR